MCDGANVHLKPLKCGTLTLGMQFRVSEYISTKL